MPLLDKLGRRTLMSYSLLLCGAFSVISMVLIQFAGSSIIFLEISKVSTCVVNNIVSNKKIQWCSFCGKFAIVCSFSTQYVLMSELYSTDVRSIGISFGSMISRIGGFIAPFIGMLPSLAFNFIFAFWLVLNLEFQT